MKMKKFLSIFLAVIFAVTSTVNCSAMISDSDAGDTGSPSDIVIPKLISQGNLEERLAHIDRNIQAARQLREGLKVSDDIIASIDAACDSYDAKLDRTRAELNRYKDGTKPTHPCPVLKDKRFYEGATAGGILVAAIATIGIGVYARITNAHSHNK